MFSEEKLSQAGQKQQSISIKSFYKHTLLLLILKNCINKLSITMFIKRKTTAGKVYAYRMVVSFKMLVYFLTSHRTTVSVLLSLDITRFFAGHCRMPCANIQACNKLYQTIRLYHKLHYDVYPSIEVLLNEDEKTMVLGTIHS